MNIARHMEAVFVVAIAAAAATSFATAAVPAHSQGGVAAVPFVGHMQVVTIVGKRPHAHAKPAHANVGQ